MMIELIDGNRLVVKPRTWAGSRRQEGFQVFAIHGDCEISEVGYTTKHMAIYELPKDTKLVVRTYRSNRFNWYFYFYELPTLTEYEVSELNGFSVAHIPLHLRPYVDIFLQKMVITNEV